MHICWSGCLGSEWVEQLLRDPAGRRMHGAHSQGSRQLRLIRSPRTVFFFFLTQDALFFENVIHKVQSDWQKQRHSTRSQKTSSWQNQTDTGPIQMSRHL